MGVALTPVLAQGAREIGAIDDLGTRVLQIPEDDQARVLDQLAHDPRVQSVEHDDQYQATVTPHDPHWQQGWGQRVVHAPTAWNMTTGEATTVIAVVDTGVDPNQPDLRGRVLKGWDFQGNDNNPRDDNGHGTAVSGVAAAAGNDGVGIAGMCWHCLILPVKVLNAAGSGSHSNIAAGIVYAVKHHADVINLSLAGAYPSNVVANAVAYARARGVVVVAAAGNEGSGRKFYPAALPGVISVGATSGNDALYHWSNYGAWVKVAAPGCAYTGKPRAHWSWWCGTSFASPVVAGTAALIKSLRPDLSRAQIEKLLLTSAVRVKGVSQGRIDTGRALRAAAALNPSDSTSSDPVTYQWHSKLSADARTADNVFHLAGPVQVHLEWATDTKVVVRVMDTDGNIVGRARDNDGDADWNGTLAAGDYNFQVGAWSDDTTRFTLSITN